MSELDIKRLIMQLEQSIREINRDIINPAIAELKLTDLSPVVKMVAQSRAVYLKTLFEMAKNSADSLPSREQINKLRQFRETYEELLKGSVALETAIERGYLDIE